MGPCVGEGREKKKLIFFLFLPFCDEQGGTVRQNPSNIKSPAKKAFYLDDGTEITAEMFHALSAEAANLKLQVEHLSLKNTYLTTMLCKVSTTQYVSKEALESGAPAVSALATIANFCDAVQEDLQRHGILPESSLSESDRQERLSAVKRDLIKAEAQCASTKEKLSTYKTKLRSSKKELRATKNLAKNALERVAQLEDEIKQTEARFKEAKLDAAMTINVLQAEVEKKPSGSRLERGGSQNVSATTTATAAAAAAPQPSLLSPRSLLAATEDQPSMSGISTFEDGKTIDGGVGQTLVHLKKKNVAIEEGRYGTLRDASGATLKTDSGLTVVNTNKKVEKMVSHETNVAKMSILEGRQLDPRAKKPSKTGYEFWYKVEMGSATFTCAPVSVSGNWSETVVRWGHEYAYVISTGLQSKPMVEVTILYRPLGKNGQPEDGDGKVVGKAQVPLMVFLPLIGTTDEVSKWYDVISEKEKEVRGSIHITCSVSSNVSRSERMLPRLEGFTK